MTDERKRTDRVIELTIDIDATLDEVWQALTTGEGIARWFAPHAAVTPGEGGSVSVGWTMRELVSLFLTTEGMSMSDRSRLFTGRGGVRVGF